MSTKRTAVRRCSMLLAVTIVLTSIFNFSGLFLQNVNAQTDVLKSLSLSGLTLSPAFSPEQTEYTATAAYNVNSTTIAAVTSGAAITVAPEELGEKALSPGKNVFTVNLFQDDAVVNTYTITVQKYARIDERDPAVIRSGADWNLSGDAGDYANTLTASYTEGDYFEYTQSCSRIKMGTRRGPGAGVVDIYLDGVLKKGDFDLWMSAKTYQQEIFDSGDLTPGLHTVKMVMKNKSTHGVSTPYGQLDYIEYIPCVEAIAVGSHTGASVITEKDGTLQMVAEVYPENAAVVRSVTWSVVNGTGSATISPSGILKAQSDGTVIVRATANDGSGIVSNDYTVTIYGQNGEAFVPVSAINIGAQDGTPMITSENGSLQLSAEVLPDNATDRSVMWSVKNGTGSATIDQDGLLTAVSKGTVTVKATAKDGSGVASNQYIVTMAYPKTTFNNPIKINKGGDPYVYRAEDGYYYMIVTEGAGNNNRITLRRSKSMATIEYGEQKVIFCMPAKDNDVWAGEINQFEGKWYVYYNSTDSGDPGRRMHVLECSDPDPMTGTWTYRNQITDSLNMYAIDGDVFQCNGRYYMLWSGKIGGIQRIYIGSMSNPYTLDSDMVMISEPTTDWETHGQPVNEGPIALLKNGKVYITFSASLYVTNYYCLGLLTADQNSNLLDPDSWTKTGPVFTGSLENSIVSTGHNGFFQSADGTEDWFVYHSVSELNQIPNERDVRMQKITWNGEVPDFGAPAPNSAELKLPSGETPADTYEAEDAAIAGATGYTTADPNQYNGFTGTGYVRFANDTGDSVTFTVTATTSDVYNILFRYTNDTADTKNMTLTVNGNVVGEAVAFPTTANANDLKNVHYYNYSLSPVTVNLNQGVNTITLETNGSNGPWLDSLIIPELENVQPPVPVKVSSIAVGGRDDVSSITTKGGTLQMVADVQPENATDRTVTWSVTNGTGNAVISASGLLTAVSDGTVTVKATANDGSNVASNGFTVTISGQSTGEPAIPVDSITVGSQSGASVITSKSGTLQMTASVLPENATDKTVTWSVTNGTGNAVISASGLLTAVSDGTVTVKATANDGSNVVSNGFTVTISGQSTGSGGDNGGSNGGNSGGSNSGSNGENTGNRSTDTGNANNGTSGNTGKDSEGQGTASPAAPKFSDMDKYLWAKEAVEALASKGIISGTSANTFDPGKKITRADFILMLVKALKLNADFTDNFADVNSDAYYYEAVGIAKKLGITAGTGKNKFDPKGEITRQDMMVLVVNALKAAGIEIEAGTAADMAGFKDISKVAGYAKDAAAALVKAGIIKGSDNSINPRSDLIRAEAAAVIYQIYLK